VAGVPIDFTERDITGLEPRTHGFGDDIIRGAIKHTSGFASEAVDQAINNGVSGAVTGLLNNQHRRDLDAIGLEPRAHGVTKVIVKGLKKHGSRIAGEAVDQAVQGAVQGVVTTVTQRQRRDLNDNAVHARIGIVLNRRTQGVKKAITKAVVKGVQKHGSRIVSGVVDQVADGVGQAVGGAANQAVTRVLTPKQHRRDLDAIELEPRTHGTKKVVVKGVRKYGSRIVSEVVDQAADGVGQAVGGAVNQAVTGALTPKQHRRDLDAIELEPRAHGITEVVVKGLKKHGSRIASEAADQAVQGAVQGVVTTVTQRQQRRDLNNIPVNGARKVYSVQRGGIASSGQRDLEELAWTHLGARGYEGLNELD